jgi:hypothetical protein
MKDIKFISTRAEVESLLLKKWDGLNKKIILTNYEEHKNVLFSSYLEWEYIDNNAKLLLLEILFESTGFFGMSSYDRDNYFVLSGLISDLNINYKYQSRKTPILIHALNLSIQAHQMNGHDNNFNILSPLITPFLLTELEYLLRSNSDYLDYTGQIKHELPNVDFIKNKKRKGEYVNQIKHALIYFMLSKTNDDIKMFLTKLDSIINNKKILFKDKTITGLADYLGTIRNLIMHGEVNILATEALPIIYIIAGFIICYSEKFI